MENNKIKSAAIAASFVAGAVTIMLLNRQAHKKTGKWAEEMREELKRRISETKDITQEEYEQIIDEIRPRYEEMKDAGAKEVGELIGELKSHWKNISEEAEKQADTAGQGQKPKKAATK